MRSSLTVLIALSLALAATPASASPASASGQPPDTTPALPAPTGAQISQRYRRDQAQYAATERRSRVAVPPRPGRPGHLPRPLEGTTDAGFLELDAIETPSSERRLPLLRRSWWNVFANRCASSRMRAPRFPPRSSVSQTRPLPRKARAGSATSTSRPLTRSWMAAPGVVLGGCC